MALSRRNPFNRFASWRLWWRGRRDGQAGIPAFNAEAQPPVLEELRDAGAHDAALEAERWQERDDALLTTWADAFLERLHAAAAVLRAEEKHEAARTAYAEANGEDAPATADRRGLAYALILALLAVIEFPINAAAFRAIGDGEYATWALAAFASVGLLTCAHLLGEQLRQTRHWSWQEILKASACAVGPFAVIGGIGYFRRLATGLHEEKLLAVGIELDPTAVTLAYVAVNVCAFIAGAALSYWAHPKGKGELNRTRKALRAARQRLDAAEQRLEDARVARQEAFDAARAHVDFLQEAVRLRAERYRQANLLARDDRDAHEAPYPASFGERLVIERPPALDTLDWSLPEEIVAKAEELEAILERDDADASPALTSGDGTGDPSAPLVQPSEDSR